MLYHTNECEKFFLSHNIWMQYFLTTAGILSLVRYLGKIYFIETLISYCLAPSSTSDKLLTQDRRLFTHSGEQEANTVRFSGLDIVFLWPNDYKAAVVSHSKQKSQFKFHERNVSHGWRASEISQDQRTRLLTGRGSWRTEFWGGPASTSDLSLGPNSFSLTLITNPSPRTRSLRAFVSQDCRQVGSTPLDSERGVTWSCLGC